MSDATIQAALQTVIRGITGTFDTADVSLGDTRIIGQGSPPYAIIFPGPLRSSRTGDWSQVTIIWTHFVEVWERFAGDDYAALTTARQAVVDEISRHPTLDGVSGVTDCRVIESSELIFLWQKGQSRRVLPSFAGFRLRVETVEETLYAGTGEFT